MMKRQRLDVHLNIFAMMKNKSKLKKSGGGWLQPAKIHFRINEIVIFISWETAVFIIFLHRMSAIGEILKFQPECAFFNF
jgi:hypothetical protein